MVEFQIDICVTSLDNQYVCRGCMKDQRTDHGSLSTWKMFENTSFLKHSTPNKKQKIYFQGYYLQNKVSNKILRKGIMKKKTE